MQTTTPDFINCISIGRIVKTVGLKGFVKVISYSDDPDRFKNIKRVFLFNEKTQKFFKNTESFEFYPAEISYVKDSVRLKFKDHDIIEAVEGLKDALVAIPEEEKVKLPPGEFFLYEVIGYDVFDKEKYLGKVKNFSDYGGGDLFVVETESKIEVLIPARKEFIKDINTEKKLVNLDLIEGFMDL